MWEPKEDLFPCNRVSHWTWNLSFWLRWLSKELPGFACLHCTVLVHATMPAIFMWRMGDLNSQHIAWQTLLPTEPPPQLLNMILLNTFPHTHIHDLKGGSVSAPAPPTTAISILTLLFPPYMHKIFCFLILMWQIRRKTSLELISKLPRRCTFLFEAPFEQRCYHNSLEAGAGGVFLTPWLCISFFLPLHYCLHCPLRKRMMLFFLIYSWLLFFKYGLWLELKIREISKQISEFSNT